MEFLCPQRGFPRNLDSEQTNTKGDAADVLQRPVPGPSYYYQVSLITISYDSSCYDNNDNNDNSDN